MLKEEDDSYGADFCPRTYFGGRELVPVGEDELTDNPAVHPHQPYIVAVYRAAVCRRIKPFSVISCVAIIISSHPYSWRGCLQPVLLFLWARSHLVIQVLQQEMTLTKYDNTAVAHAKQLSLLSAP